MAPPGSPGPSQERPPSGTVHRSILGMRMGSDLGAGTSPLIGRSRELATLLDGLGEADAGHPRLYLVAGEPGIGKSRLIEEFGRHAAARDATVLWGRCWEAGGAPPYWPWVQSLRAYLRQ